MTPWSLLVSGDEIRSKNGQVWTFVGRSPDGKVRIERNGVFKEINEPAGSVEVVASSAEVLAAAQAAVKVVMPGSVTVAQQPAPGEPWSVPRAFPDPGSFQAHCYIFHGEHARGETMREIAEVHEAWHQQTMQTMAHLHQREFWENTA